MLSLGEALDNAALAWTTGGDSDWFHQTQVYTYDGDAAQSGPITDSQSTWLRTTVTGPGTLSFYWKVASQPGRDYLSFHLDGKWKTQISGMPSSWAQRTFSIDSGTHTLEWRYSKDSSVSQYSDCGWLDKVEFEGTALMPTPIPPPTPAPS